MENKVTVVIPSYNERTRLPPTLSDIESFCLQHDVVSEVIVVDDCSRDQTVERAMYYQGRIPGFKILRHADNKGKWASINTGIDAAYNDWILLLDSDSSASIWELQAIDFEDSEYAYFGTRFSKASKVHGKNFFRTVISHGYRLYVRFWFWFASGKFDVDDMQCPFKLFRRSKLNGSIESERYSGDIELALRLKQPIKSVTVDFVHKGGSKVKLADIFKMAYDTCITSIWFRSNKKLK